ncbi:MAG TPA: hypothetical protein VGO92_07655 [Acidimicrobiales bacterium]|nr:hypothetical protein [Acidimicrobiales bacterium]
MRVLACVALSLGLLAACSDGGREKKAAPVPSTTTTTAPPEFKLVVGSVDVQTMTPGADKLPDDVRAQVTATLSTYLAQAVVAPLQTGVAAVGLDAVFTPVALARLAAGTPDRAALVEEPPAAAGTVAPDKEDVSLTVLIGQAGETAVVSATLDLAVVLTTSTGRIRIGRTGEVLLVPMPGGWRIDGYDVAAKRDTLPPPPAPTTTTGKKT